MSPDPYSYSDADKVLLRQVDRWPLVLRQAWATRTLEIYNRRHCSLELAEVEAAKELRDRAAAYQRQLLKGHR